MDLFNSPTFHDHVKGLMQLYHVPGMSITVSSNEDVKSTAFGVVSRKSGTPCITDTLFDIASCSKSLTAATVALLVGDEEGYPHVHWNTPVAELMPKDFVMPTPELTRSVTVEDILSHRTGMPTCADECIDRHDFSYYGPSAASPDTPQTVTRNLRNLPMAALIRSEYFYNNMMFTVAVHLVEHLTGSSFSNFLQQNFLAPLGMTSTYLQPSSAIAAQQGDRIASGHYYNKQTQVWNEFSAWNAPEAVGAGSIVTSTEDYIKWIQALLHRHHPVDAAVYTALTKPRMLVGEDVGNLKPGCSPEMYGLGLNMHWYRGYQIVEHGGLIAGFGGTILFIPAVGFGACILGNASGIDDLVYVLQRELIDAALEVPQSDRPDWFARLDSVITKSDDERDVEEGELRSRLSGGGEVSTECSASNPSIEAFLGEYWNTGYHSFTVTLKDGALFIDALDRSFPATLVFEPMRTWCVTDDHKSVTRSSFIAHLVDLYEGGDEYIEAVFDVSKDQACRMGLKLEPDLPDELPGGSMIWFERVT